MQNLPETVNVIPVLEWFASCQIITKNSVADAYGLEAEQLKDDDYRRVIASMPVSYTHLDVYKRQVLYGLHDAHEKSYAQLQQ